MSILRNSTYQAQPWWNNEKASWYDPPPEQLLYQDEYFGRREWGYNSTGIDWPPSRFILGRGSVYDFSSIPCLATLTGSFTSPLTITISSTIPKWTADIVMRSPSWSVTGDMPVWTPSVNLITGEVISVSGEVPKWTPLIQMLAEQINIAGNFPKWTMSASISTGEILTVSGNILAWTMSASVLSGEMIAVAGIVPRWLASATLYPNVGLFVISGQVPRWIGLLSLREMVANVYGATVMNASNFAVTEYGQYPISSLGYMNDHYYGTLSDGIYLLEGKDDNGTEIVGEIETGLIDLGMGYLKRLREAWFVFRSDGTVILRVRVDEQDSYEEELAYLHDRIREGRVKIAKGLKKRFAALGLKNVRGSDFDLDSIRVIVDPIREKIR